MINEITLYNTVTKVAYNLDNDNATFLISDGSIDWGDIESTHQTFSYPNQVGKYLSSTTIGSRQVTIFGWIVGGTEGYAGIKRKKRLLNQFINPLHPIEIRAGKYKLIGSPDTQVRYSKEYEENNDVICRFLISIYCSDPMFKSLNPYEVVATTTRGMFKMPLIITEEDPVVFGEIQNSLFSELVNDGVLPIGGIIRFESKGVVNTPTFYNVDTLEFIKLNTTITAGQVIEVSTVEGNRYVKLITTQGEEDYFRYLDLDSSWIQFIPGKTTIGFGTSDNGIDDETYKNLTIRVLYNPVSFNLEEE